MNTTLQKSTLALFLVGVLGGCAVSPAYVEYRQPYERSYYYSAPPPAYIVLPPPYFSPSPRHGYGHRHWR